MFNPVIIFAIIIQSFVAKFSRIAGAVLGYIITTGILLWGISIFGEGSQIALFGIPLSEPVFFIACLVWYAFDTKELVAAGDKAKNTNSLVLVMKNDKDWMKRLDAAEALARKNDKRGLDYLNESLESSNADIREVANEILSGLSSNANTKIPTEVKILTPEEIELKRIKKESLNLYKQKVFKEQGRCVICGKKIGIIDRFKGEIHCTEHIVTQ
jgi:hypothetical protein